MNEPEETRVERASAAGADEVRLYIHDPSPRVVRSLLQGRNVTEEDVLIVAGRKNLPSDVLEMIAKDRRWSESYPVKLALARNPRSPLTVSLSIARFLRVFDLEELTRSPHVPSVFRHKVESMLTERIPTMPLGNKKTLAKKAAGAVLLKLLQERIPEVVRLCLNNPHLVEAHLFKVIARVDTVPETILLISQHSVWSRRPLIRYSLVRNTHTPLSTSIRFLKDMKLVDLRELYADPSLPVTIKPFVYRELLERGSDPASAGQDQFYEIGDEEVLDLDPDKVAAELEPGEDDRAKEDDTGEKRDESPG
ncbi:MAG TPA: hypothetical protein VL197_07765 [Nitrospirota bacterium]|nr:hypothetical protein [Nitrospirota bacterium]